MNRHLLAPARVHTSQPYLYILPADLIGLKRIAFVRSMDAAMFMRSQGMSVTEEKLLIIAEQQARYYASLTVEGKRGANDPQLFHKTFTQVFIEAFPQCMTALETSAYRVAPGLPDEERLAQHYEYAKGRVG